VPGYPSLMPLFEKYHLTQELEILSQKTRVLGAADGEDSMILSCTVLIRLQSVSDRQTDRWMTT